MLGTRVPQAHDDHPFHQWPFVVRGQRRQMDSFMILVEGRLSRDIYRHWVDFLDADLVWGLLSVEVVPLDLHNDFSTCR